MYLQAEFLVPLGVECGAFDGRGPDELGRKSGMEAVALLATVQTAAVARAVAVVVAHAGSGDATQTRSTGRDVVAVASGANAGRRFFPLETQPEAGMFLESLDGHHRDKRIASLTRRRTRRQLLVRSGCI